MTPIIVVPARMDSSRLPGKPLAEIAGQPMIVHVLRRAEAAGIGPVAVACAEEMVAESVRAAGGRVVLTDPRLPSGSDRIHAALAELDPGRRHDVVVNLQGDLPTIEPGALATLLRVLDEPRFDIATLAAPIETAAEAEAASVVKIACAFADGAVAARAHYFSRTVIPHGIGPLWHHVGVYAYRRPALDAFVGAPQSPLEAREGLEQLRALESGLAIGVGRIDKAPFGVDTPDDLDRIRRTLS